MRFLAARRILKWKECARRKAEHPEERCVRPRRRPHRGGPRPRRREAGRCVAPVTPRPSERRAAPVRSGESHGSAVGGGRALRGKLLKASARRAQSLTSGRHRCRLCAGCSMVPHRGPGSGAHGRKGLRRCGRAPSDPSGGEAAQKRDAPEADAAGPRLPPQAEKRRRRRPDGEWTLTQSPAHAHPGTVVPADAQAPSPGKVGFEDCRRASSTAAASGRDEPVSVRTRRELSRKNPWSEAS